MPLNLFRALFLLSILVGPLAAQVDYNGGIYSQDFDSLPGPVNNTLNQTWTDNVTLPGWYANKATFSVTDGTVGGAAATFDSTSASVNNVGLFSFGAASGPDRALGSRATSNFAGNSPVLYGVRFVNNTGQTLTRFTLFYTGEQWFKSSAATAHTILIDYQVGAADLVGGTWTAVPGGTFTAPMATGTTATALDGDAAANSAKASVVVTGLSWAPGQELWLRFSDANESGNEQGLAVDDVHFLADEESGLYFDGNSSHVTMGQGAASATAFGASDFTVECRVVRTGPGVNASTGTGGVSAVPLIAKGVGEADGSNKDANYFLGIDSTGRLVADFEQLNATNNGTAYNAGQNFPVVGSTVLQDWVWYHLAASYDTTTATWKLYVDGVEETVSVPPGSPATFVGVVPRDDSIQGLGVGATIKSTGAVAGFFQGIIDEVRIWDVVRSAAEIAGRKDVEITSGQAGMLARFGFDEASGTTATGSNESGVATPAGTLSGTVLPAWINARAFDASNAAPTVTPTGPADGAVGVGASINLAVDLADSEGDALGVTFYGRVAPPVTPGPDFSLIAIPDTQFYSENTGRNPSPGGTGAVAAIYNAQTQWIVDNRAARNIAFVSHMGDLAQNGDGIESEWIVADTAQKLIENPLTTLRGHGIPWACAPGNHDQQPFGDAGGTTNFYNQYFNFARWDGRPYFGGRFGAKNNNNYQLFSASGLDFIIIHLEYDLRALSFYQPVHDWADALLKAYPERRAIVTSHWILEPGDPAGFSTQGQNIYDALKDNPNLFLMLCGHRNGEGRREDVYQGHTVRSILSDYKDTKNGGNGFLRVLTFRPSLNEIHVESYSPTLDRAVDSSDAIPSWTAAYDLDYEMQEPVTDWIPLGTVNVAGGGTSANLAWTGLEAGKVYEWRASASDGSNVVTTETRSFSTVVPVAPTVELSSPADGASFALGATINLGATADDADGSVVRVEFFDGGTKLGEDDSAPYSLAWDGAPGGTHVLSAVVTDDSGLDALSAVVHVFVDNTPPSVALTAPTAGQMFDAPAAVSLSAAASDSDGTVVRVEFRANGALVGEDTSAPYDLVWSGVFTGSYTLTATAFDDDDAFLVSAPVEITVTNVDNVAPAVAITSPEAGPVAAGSVTIIVNASDTDGVVSKVEYFDGAVKLGETVAAPHSFVWAAPTPGSHSLSAQATDNDGGVTTSASVLIDVQGPPLSFAEDFDLMGPAGTAPPAGWSFFGYAGGSSSTWTSAIPEAEVGGGTVNASLSAVTDPSTQRSATEGYNLATGASPSDRALGTSPTGTQGVAL